MLALDKIKMEKIRVKIPLLIPFVAAISLSFTLVSSYFGHEHALETAKKNELIGISDQIASDFLKIAGKAESRADMLATIPGISKAFYEENRTWLWDQLRPMFLKQNKDYDISEIQFHKSPASTFLKLHKEGDYGEDLSDFRQTVVSANKLKSSQKGLELGRAGLGIRGVVPVFYENEHIGSLEFAFSFKSVLQKIKDLTGADVSIFVNKKLFDRICTGVSQTDENAKKLTNEEIEITNTIGNFRYLESTDKEKIMSMLTATYLNKSTEFYTTLPIIDGAEQGLALGPLFDFSGTKIGAIIINKTFEKLNAMYRAKFVNEVIINIIEIILIAFISIVIYNVMLIFPLSKISAICRDIADGKKGTFQKFTQAPNEIGMLAQVLEKLFEALDDAAKDKGKK
ncbi:MAG: hypothetical protein EBT45_06430 [Alphaproteobacteria bacterium]|nr:hypothetical protein [Alphaproteobacteria bacterium]